MPYTGFDPYGPEPDPSGGGLDPSFYYAASPGGRFPGDDQFFLEWLAAQSRGTAGGNPDYDVPDWMTKWGKLGRALGWHERNVQNGGEGQSPNLPGGYPYHFFSGPAASYGPPGGPLHGLVDQGRPGDPWDGADRPPYVPQDTGDGKKKKGGGGGGGHKLTFTPYQGMQGQGGSFVGWQPTHPFSGSSGPTQFVQGGGAAPVATAPSGTPALGVGGGGLGKSGGGGQGGGGGKGAGKNGGKGQGTPGGGGKPGQGGDPLGDLLGWLTGRRDRVGPGHSLRDSIGGGVDTGNLDKGTPGWLRDPTTGVHNTGGFPGPTPFGPNSGESFDSYLTRLHDAGFDSGSIGSMLGPYGYRQNEAGGWEWGWGTGPVVRGENGYQFANQGGSIPVMTDPGQLGGAGGMYRIGDDNRPGGGGPGGGAGAGAGNAGPGGGGKPNAADYLAGGVFNLPAY